METPACSRALGCRWPGGHPRWAGTAACCVPFLSCGSKPRRAAPDGTDPAADPTQQLRSLTEGTVRVRCTGYICVRRSVRIAS